MDWAEIFGFRSTFAIAVLSASWAAIILLALIAANLHARVANLERAARVADSPRNAYSHLLGRGLGAFAPPSTEVVLILSRDCPACEGVVRQLQGGEWRRRSIVAWKGGENPEVDLPGFVEQSALGSRLSEELGINVSPFALELDHEGRVIGAGPVNSLNDIEAEAAVGARR